MKKLFVSLVALILSFGLFACNGNKEDKCEEHIDRNKNNICDECGEKLGPTECAEHKDENNDGKCDECGADVEVKQEGSIKDDFDCITIAEAIELAKEAGSAGTSDKYYVYGKITEVSNATYGSMTIEDETGSIYVYGVYSKDEQTRYDALEDRPLAGDEVVLYGILKEYKGTPEIDRGYLQALKHADVEVEVKDYPEEAMPISEIRELEEGTLLRATGVVAHITYAFGMNPNGFYLVDETGSIYVYGKETAAKVQVGNTITIVGEKTYYVLDTEQSSANKYGYKGCNQIQDVTLVENDNQKTEWNKEWVEETTVKQLMDTPATEDITTSIHKVTALVKKVEGTGFTNYYIDDLDGVTGSYTYTACSGSDFAWLDEFDGKICTVYLSVINAKSTTSGCLWRFMPIEVKDEGFVFDQANGAQFVLDYYVKEQFLSVYESDPEALLVTSVSNELIGIDNALVSYVSSNEEVVYFESTEDGEVLHVGEVGKATVTITVSYAGVVKTYEVEIESKEAETFETITVQEAVASEDGTVVTLKGIVASSLVNQSGFYLIDDTGVIAVVAPEDQVKLLSSGDEVVIRGTKSHKVKEDYLGAGQINVYDSTILANYYGNHEYSTSTFDTSKTLAELRTLDHMEDHSNEVYVVQGKIELIETAYYTSIKLKSVDGATEFTLYCSSANQYKFLHQFAGKEITLELALCNWNSKNYYAGCVISATCEGVKVVNTLNFDE